MSDLLSRLRALPQKIRVGVIGIGNIGRGIVYQTSSTPGIECIAIADINIDRASDWVVRLGRDYRVVENEAGMSSAIRSGRLAVCRDGNLIASCKLVDVLVDSSSSIFGGLEFALSAISHHKHVVMMNSEADLIFGPYLLAEALRAGVIYTSADGDQHTVLKRLVHDIELWGFQTVMVGNMKGYLDRYSNPSAIMPEASKRFMGNKMCTSYTDGTKLSVEMALIANAIGGRAVVPGMLGPRIRDIYDLWDYFDFSSLWDGNVPLVDYVLGAYPSGGVFVVGFNDHPHQMETLSWYPCRLGPGPFYVFHRPYHLGHIEIIASIAEAFLDGWGVLQPSFGFKTNVYSYAKKDLVRGEVLDGIGGYTAYGMIENCADNIKEPGLPICLAESLKLVRDIPKDQKININDVAFDVSDPGFSIYQKALQS